MFLAIALIPILFVSALIFHNYRNSIEAGRLSQMQNIAAYKADKIETYFADLRIYFELSQVVYVVKMNLPVFTRLANDPDNPEFVAARKMVDAVYRNLPSSLGLLDIMLTEPQGRIVYSSNPEHFSKEFLNFLPDPQQKAFEEGRNKVYFTDIFFNKARNNEPSMLITGPAHDFNDVFIGVIAAEVNMKPVYKLIQDMTGLGKTGETLIGRKMGNQVEYLNPLRYDPNAALTRSVNIGDKIGVGIQKAIQGTGAGQYFDYRGKKVVAAWRYIPSLDWGLVAKMDTDEAFADVTNLRNLAMIILIIVFALSGITAFSIAQSISEPIKRLSEGAAIIGSGNLDYKLGTNLKDEIGQLSRSFDKMTSDLKQTTASRDELSVEVLERKEAEEALRESEQNLSTVFRASPTGIFITRLSDGLFLDVNEAFLRIVEYSADEVIGHSSPELNIWVNPEDRERIISVLRQQGRTENREIKLRRKDGEVVDVLSSTLPLERRGESCVLGTITDITAIKQAEEALRKAHDELELRVKERTADLDETVAELESQVQQRIKAEETIKAERKRFEGVLEMMPAYAVLLTPDYHVAYANRTFRNWFGDDNGKKCYEFLFNRTEPCETCETYTVLKTGRNHFWEWTGPNGHSYDIYDYPFTDTDGSPLIMEIGVDVTEHKQAQEGLRLASKYARGLLEASLDPLVTISQDGKITDVNKATELATGVNREKLIGSDFSSYFTEPEKAKEGYQKVISEGFVRDYPLTIRNVSGSMMDVLYNATVYKNAAGEVQGVFAAARDVTKSKLAEEKQNVTNLLLKLYARRTSRKEYLDSVVKVIRNWSTCEFIGIRIKDAEGNIPYESYVGFDQDFLALENQLHLERDNCICIRAMLQNPQKQDEILLTEGGSFYCNDSPAFLKGLSQKEKKEYRGNCIKRGFLSIAVVPIHYRDEILGVVHLTDFKKDMVLLPKIQFIENTIAPLIGEAIKHFNAESELEKHHQHLEDIVQQRTDELVRSNKDLSQFAYVASHDLQEPLRIIAGYTQLLQHRYKGKIDDDADQFISFTVESTSRMQNLINDLLSYSRLETRGRAFEPVDSQAVLDEVTNALRMTIEESGAVITHTRLPTIRADRTQLFQLFQNLIGNAIKFRSDKPLQIHIAAEPTDDERWLFSVKDNGIGIDPKYAERIFIIFQRLHSRDKYPGTGIGLSICKKIVECHGGRIWVESQPGNGATFYFTI
jgi:PAS domain S-box-containing protein